MSDITKGDTFVDGQQCNGARLNALVDSAVISTAFHTAKASAGTSPAKATTEVMVYDTAAATYKKGSLSALVLDSGELLTARTAKATPIAADALLLSDSAAAGALKQVSASGLLYGAAAHTTPVAADKIPIYNSVGAALGHITLANLVGLLAQHTVPVAADQFLTLEAGGAVRRVSLAALISGIATSLTPVVGGELIAVNDAGTMKKVTLASLISAAAALASPSGTEQIQLNNAGTLGRITTSELRFYATRNFAQFDEQYVSLTDVDLGAAGWHTRQLNTSVFTANLVTPPAAGVFVMSAGDYRVRAWGTAIETNLSKLRVYNVTDAAVLVYGASQFVNASSIGTVLLLDGVFTIAAGKQLALQQYNSNNPAGAFSGGQAVGQGTEVYSSIQLERLT